LIGVNNNTIFSLDPRINSNDKMATHFQYSNPPKMSCLASTGDGQVVVGDLKGEIRLFSDVNKRAKNLFPGLGDSVIGIDVTEDGNYICATAQSYLLVIATALPNGKNGFRTAMGDRKPRPWKLSLKAHHLVEYNIDKVCFTPAHFNTGVGIQEESIVTSTGPFIVTWSLDKVKKGKLDSYKIKRCLQEVVADQFLFAKNDQVVVTLPDDVLLERRTSAKLKKSKQ